MLCDEKLLRIHKKAAVCRAFEEEVYRQVESKKIQIPVYLSAGQEYISATISEFVTGVENQVFIQHRGHSTYLSFAGKIDDLIFELLGDPRGCANGMGGSASIQSREGNIFGHDGLMGSQGPIATGACYGNKKFTVCFTGDAAAEEDYFVAAIGWASTKKLPIWYVVEDNNLSILTEKKVRRIWEMHDVAVAFKMKAFDVSDDPKEIWTSLEQCNMREPALFNVRTQRLFWHAGAGIDNPNIPDTHKKYVEYFGEKYDREAKELVSEAWKRCLR